MRRPAATSSAVVVVSSQRTIIASVACAPSSAPRSHSASRKARISRSTAACRDGVFGSKTSQARPDSQGQLDHGDEPPDVDVPPGASPGSRVRAPICRIPRPGRTVITLTDAAFSRPWVASSTAHATSRAPTTVALAGALCTPTVRSVRATDAREMAAARHGQHGARLPQRVGAEQPGIGRGCRTRPPSSLAAAYCAQPRASAGRSSGEGSSSSANRRWPAQLASRALYSS